MTKPPQKLKKSYPSHFGAKALIHRPEDEPGQFTEKDAALGTFDNLKAFAGKARTGFDAPTPQGLWKGITDLIDETVANGGKIRFKLDGFIPGEALDPKSQYYDSYSANEFRYVMRKYPEKVVFYRSGCIVAPPSFPRHASYA
jgi:hypothetical protein